MGELKTKIEEGIRKQSYAVLLGLQVEEAEEGRVVISCQKRPDLLQQTGIFHGGVTGGMCEATASYAALTVLPEGQSVVGVEYKISLLRAITADKVIAEAKVLKRGKQLVVVDVEAFNDGSDKVAAKMLFTGMIIEE
ncbi:MAG: PaaI family thioesterase [Ruminiclostridium sp.]|nr:PaaI family thioesterase [Ruminiclostridium sp.]